MSISMLIELLIVLFWVCVFVDYTICAFTLIIACIIIANLDERLPVHAEMFRYAKSNFYKWYIPVQNVVAGITLALMAYEAWKEYNKK